MAGEWRMSGSTISRRNSPYDKGPTQPDRTSTRDNLVMATLHFICGKAASGKTTLARELAARHAAVMFGEDEWLTLLDAEIDSLADHMRHSKRLKAVFAPFCVRLLQLGVPIVFDFAGNTPNDRAWV